MKPFAERLLSRTQSFLVSSLLLASCVGAPASPNSGPSPTSGPPPASGPRSESASSASLAMSAAPPASASSTSEAATDDARFVVPPPATPIVLKLGGKFAVTSAGGMVTSVEAHASEAGAKVLREGGNAIDAAVAVGYALAVTHPSAGNLGGGGFMIVALKTGERFAIDFRETAPKSVTTAKVLEEVRAGAFGYASMAVPGTVAGLNLARDRFGTQPLPTLLAPAIDLSTRGFKLNGRVGGSLSREWPKLKSNADARRIWGRGGQPKKEGDRVTQPELAATLRAIAERGDAGFYDGPVAEAIASAMTQNKGDITLEDLRAYRAKVREPLRFRYRGFDVATMPPPSMGGLAVAETLLRIERTTPVAPLALPSPEDVHIFIEAAKRSYADRRSLGADPDFYENIVAKGALSGLLSPRSIAERRPLIGPRATPASELLTEPSPKESPETTHFSVVDREGNAVSCTVTLSAAFGSKVVIPKTGVFFSNALGAFSPSGVNEAAPGKRMASSMSPTILSRDGAVEAVVGSPGGDTIPNTVAQVIWHLVDHQMTVDEAVLAGRFHHQLTPDEVRFESSRPIPPSIRTALGALGHTLTASPTPIGDAKVIVRDPKTGTLYGIADAREGGLAATDAPSSPTKKSRGH